MTNQTMFNRVSKHLLTQKRKSVNKGECAYYGPNNLKCAVGVLIPRAKYSPSFEGYGVNGSLDRCADLRKVTGIDTPELIEIATALQYVHDDNKPSQWKAKLKQVAKQFELKADVLEGF